jgi:hypothetical protein
LISGRQSGNKSDLACNLFIRQGNKATKSVLQRIEDLNGAAIAMARSRCIPNGFETKTFTAFIRRDYRPDIFGIPISIDGAGSNHKGSGSQWRRLLRFDLAQPGNRSIRRVVDECDQPVEYRGTAQRSQLEDRSVR